MKKGQVTAFVTLGIVILVLLGIIIFNSQSGQKEEIDKERLQSMDFSQVKTNLRSYVNDCLEQTALRAIDEFGLKEETLLSGYIDANILRCLDYFSFVEADVDYGQPQSAVTISSNIATVDLDFPIRVSSGGETINEDEFRYQLVLQETLNAPGGILKAGTTMYFGDEDFILSVDEDTMVTDVLGNPVEQIFVKAVDKNFDNLGNNVVMGKIAYDAGPEGVVFSPPVQVMLRLRKADLFRTYKPSEPKLAWYDVENDIWRTYEACEFREDDLYYYYCGNVDHFTPVAVVACGNEDTEFNIRLEYIYESPLKVIPGREVEWIQNTLSGADEGKHISFEDMGNVECLFLSEIEPILTTVSAEISIDDAGVEAAESKKKYNVQDEEGFPEISDTSDGIEQCLFMLGDWDGDDQVKESSGYEFELTYKQGGSDYTLPPNFNDAPIREACRSACSEAVKESTASEILAAISSYESDIEEGISAIFGIEADDTDAIIKEKIISLLVEGRKSDEDEAIGDGLKDGSTLNCEVTVPSGSVPDAILSEYVCNTDEEDRATPYTYGYSDADPNDFKLEDNYERENTFGERKEYVGGYGSVPFKLLEEGAACIDDYSSELKKVELLNPLVVYDARIAASLGVTFDVEYCDTSTPPICGGNAIGEFDMDHPEKIVVDPGDTETSGISCSSGDTCIWILNNNRPLSGGENFVGVRVQNEFESGDAYAFASSILRFSGTGVSGQEECGVTVGQRLEYLRGCGLAEYTVPEGAQIEIDCLAEKPAESMLCELSGLSQECQNIIYLPGRATGGICQGDVKICPGMMIAGVDDGCQCGGSAYEGSNLAYCCDGIIKIISNPEEDINGCWQTSPLALTPIANVCAEGRGRCFSSQPAESGWNLFPDDEDTCVSLEGDGWHCFTYSGEAIFDCAEQEGICKLGCNADEREIEDETCTQKCCVQLALLEGVCCVGAYDSKNNQCPAGYWSRDELPENADFNCAGVGATGMTEYYSVSREECHSRNEDICPSITGFCINPSQDCVIDPATIPNDRKKTRAECDAITDYAGHFVPEDGTGHVNRDILNQLCEETMSCCIVGLSTGEDICFSEFGGNRIVSGEGNGQLTCNQIKTNMNNAVPGQVLSSVFQEDCTSGRFDCLNSDGSTVNLAESTCRGTLEDADHPGLPERNLYPIGTVVCGVDNVNFLYECKRAAEWEETKCEVGCRETDDGFAQCYEDSGFCLGNIPGDDWNAGDTWDTIGGSFGGCIAGAAIGWFIPVPFIAPIVGCILGGIGLGVTVGVNVNDPPPNPEVTGEFLPTQSVCKENTVYTCKTDGSWDTEKCKDGKVCTTFYIGNAQCT